ncbi:nucleotidyltransferase family protein [Bowmanella yangjiangensis]|uniref:Nucleotidyltransferase family protein n=1 Tax=Bowmanella yangjiangensis TaxID=2811230 RepID=A0ABS3CP28_9ALTE|nr:nucleotidyltransferase family protein [Bowmanella yangjiangensis]MBN7818872.1 nucleotidyltransferase family protein [Bowmanella yangjiangensis]
MSYDWKNILVSPEQPIRDVLQVIDNEALRIALVVDTKEMLLGVVTDGDIRRGLLKNISIQDKVELVMNTRPLTGNKTMSRNELVQLMEYHKLLAIPLLEDNARVVGLETLHRVGRAATYQNPVLLMAGGYGSRLRPLTNNCPKPMLRVGNKPILEILLKNFIKAGFVNFFISTHYLSEVIEEYFGNGEKWGVSIKYVYEDTPLGTAGALSLLPKELPDLPVLIINGDILTNVDFDRLLKFHNKNNADATMCVRDYEYQVPFGVIKGNGITITELEEKPIQRFFVNAGIYAINPEIINTISKQEKLDMTDLLDSIINKSGKVIMFPIHEYWMDIGRLDDFHRAQLDVANILF